MEIIVVFFLVLCFVIAIIAEALINFNSPIIARKARIVRKNKDEGMQDGSGHRTHWGYIVVFEFSNGQRKKFKVNSWQYFKLKKGTTGVLHSQGSWYKGFDEV